ncbi:MAG: hypothetical protein WKF79_00435 [Nocardioides sp.]
MLKGLSEAFKGIGGNYELNRLVGFFGGVAYTICANVFVGYDVFVQGKPFDITAYCLAFPAGVAAIAGGTAAAISLKDRNVASSRVIEQTGAVPTKARDGAKVPTGDPPPVQEDRHDTGGGDSAPADALPSYAQ